MRILRLHPTAALAFLVSLMPIPLECGFAQQRPNVRTFVTPPEGCSIADPVDTKDLYSFIKVQIKALSFAQQGENANRELLAAKSGPPVDEIAKVLAGLRNERIDILCANFLVSLYADSENVYTATAAKSLASSYDELGTLADEMLRLTLMASMQRNPWRLSGTEFPKLIARRQKILGDMADALNLSLLLLIDERRFDVEGKPDHMVFTASQRDELLNYLYSEFPSLKNVQAGKPGYNFVKQAALIQSFLSGPYKSSDR